MSGRRRWGDDSSVTVKLSKGASVQLVFRGSLFDLAETERQLLGDLTEVIQRHGRLQQGDANSEAVTQKGED